MRLQTLMLLVFCSRVLLGKAEDEENDEGVEKQVEAVAEDPRVKREALLEMNKMNVLEHLMEDLGFTKDGADAFFEAFSKPTHFFLLNDVDQNAKLDGLEILQGLRHDAAHSHEDTDGQEDDTSATVIRTDELLETADVDDDGFIEFTEFVSQFKRLFEYDG